MSSPPISRRRFLGSVATAAALVIVPRHVLGGPGFTAPSEVLTRGTIGTGSQGLTHVAENREGEPPVQRAVCDVDRRRLAEALARAGRGCEGCGDFRRVLDRTDIDVIHIATPPHWHALIALAAVQAGKDVLCEKPLTRFIREGRVLADAARRNGRIVMCNTFGRRGWPNLRRLVAGGALGRPLRVHVGPRSGFGFKVRQWTGRTAFEPQPVPAELDYDFWLGPAPLKPYDPHRVRGGFRAYWDYDGGGLTDMGQHWADAVQYLLGKDDTGPAQVEAAAPWPAHPEACGLWGRLRLTYADGTIITLESGEWGDPEPGQPAFIEGPRGKVIRTARGTLTAEPAGLFDPTAAGPDDLVDFATAVKTRSGAPAEKPDAEEAHRSATLLHLGNIAIRTGRPIRWDPVTERILGDDGANRLVDVPLRAPWHL